MTSPALRAATQRLRVDRVTAEVVSALDAAGATTILLKGPSIARWLYEGDGRRTYADTDLLVDPDSVTTAEDVLGELGFRRAMSDEQLGEALPAHAWSRAADRTMIDLHRTLPGAEAHPRAVWDLLVSRTQVLTLGSVECRAPDPDVLAAHVAIHAALHGAGVQQPLEDLRRVLVKLSRPDWERAAEVAAGLEASEAFATGLRLDPHGTEVAERLGLATDATVELRLRAATAPPTALGMARLVRTPGAAAKLALLARKAVPSPAFLRHWSPIARRGPLGLAAAYAIRPFWLLAHLPAGVLAWRRAVRAAADRASLRSL